MSLNESYAFEAVPHDRQLSGRLVGKVVQKCACGLERHRHRILGCVASTILFLEFGSSLVERSNSQTSTVSIRSSLIYQ